MKKVPGINYLHERGGVYYFRRAVPDAVKAAYGKDVETRSLRTKDFTLAKQKVQELAAHFGGLFDQLEHYQKAPARSELTPEEIKIIADGFYRMVLEDHLEAREEGMVPEYGGTYAAYYDKTRDTLEMVLSAEQHHHARAEISPGTEDELEDFLSYFSGGVKVDKASPVWRRLLLAVQDASIRAMQDELRLMNGEPITLPPVSTLATPIAVDGSPLLSEIIVDFLEAKQHITQRTKADYATFVTMFIESAGDRPFRTYLKQDGKVFTAQLRNCASNKEQHSLTAGKPLPELAKLAEEYDLPRLAPKTVNKYISGMQAVFNWAGKKLDAHLKPGDIQVFSPHIIENAASIVERLPFTTGDLQAIFTTPVYTGAASAQEWRSLGNYRMEDTGLYWVPLLALFTGARLQELCQLYTSDVKTFQTEAGELIHYLDINAKSADAANPDKFLKNQPSNREVSLHHELLRIGFLSLVERRRRTGSLRLFPDVTMSAYDGRYASTFSRTFRDLRHLAGIIDRSKPFHSFRHLFEDLARNAMPGGDDLRKGLMGRKEGGSSDTYGLGFWLTTTNDAIQAVKVPELDLSHLYV